MADQTQAISTPTPSLDHNPQPQIQPQNHNNPPPPGSTDLKSRIKASYDALAPKYNEWTIAHSTTKLHYLDILLNHLLSSSPSTPTISISILELGCGHGLPITAKLLSYPNISVTANDLSSAQIDLARANLLPPVPDPTQQNEGRLTLLEGDMLALTFPPSTFHAVVAMYSIIHLPRLEQISMLRQIVTWLKPGGWVLANFGAEESGEEGHEVGDWLGGEKKGEWMYWSGWGVEGTLQKMEGVGLVVETKEVVVDRDEGGDVRFLWVLGRKKEDADGGE